MVARCPEWLAATALVAVLLFPFSAKSQDKRSYSYEAIFVRVEGTKLIVKSPKTNKELKPVEIDPTTVIQRKTPQREETIRVQDLREGNLLRISKEGQKENNKDKVTKIQVISS